MKKKLLLMIGLASFSMNSLGMDLNMYIPRQPVVFHLTNKLLGIDKLTSIPLSDNIKECDFGAFLIDEFDLDPEQVTEIKLTRDNQRTDNLIGSDFDLNPDFANGDSGSIVNVSIKTKLSEMIAQMQSNLLMMYQEIKSGIDDLATNTEYDLEKRFKKMEALYEVYREIV